MSSLRFHTRQEIKPSERYEGSVAHMKFTLVDPQDNDVVACLIIRQPIASDLSVEALNDVCVEHAEYIEPMLRKAVDEQNLFTIIKPKPKTEQKRDKR